MSQKMNNGRTSDCLLGLDIGGTGCKTAVYTPMGDMLGEGYAEYAMISTSPGQAEHDAEKWWQAAVDSIRMAIDGLDTACIKSVGIGCTNGLIAVDQNAQPLRPAIMLWDQRSLPEVSNLHKVLGRKEMEKITGNPAAPGAYSLPTIMWLKNHEPKTFEMAYKFMVPGGFLVAQLTGKFSIDYSRACTTQLFDIRHARWHKPFFEKLGLQMDKFPPIYSPSQIVGGVTESAAEKTGLKSGTPVVAGFMDTVGAAIGANSLYAGQCFIIMGTAARVTTLLEEAVFDTRLMNTITTRPDQWMGLGAMNGVGSVLRWARDVIAKEELTEARRTGKNVYDLLTEQASQSPPGSKGLVLLPYMAGERTPIWDPYARGTLFGLSLGHTRSDIFRAFLEGPSFAIRQTVEILEKLQSIPIRSAVIGGTAASSKVWNQIIADVIGKPVFAVNATNVEVLGAAVIGGVGIGIYSNLENGMHQVAQERIRFDPNSENHAHYNALYGIYQKLYPSIASMCQELVDINLPKGWVK
jgi:xylulokinase